MRYALTAVLFAVLAMPVSAQNTGTKKDRAEYLLGFGYRSGSFTPVLPLESGQRIDAGKTVLFGEVRSRRGYFYGETTFTGGIYDRMQTHALGFQSAMFRVFGFSLDAGIDYRYLAEPAPVFIHGNTRMESTRRQHAGLFSLGGRWGDYDGFYVRYGGSIGIAYVENSLDLFIDGKHESRNISDVDTGLVRLYGLKAESGFRLRGFRLRGGMMQFIITHAPPGGYTDTPIVFGSVSYATPWHAGVFLQGTKTLGTDAQHLTFLNDTVTFGVTVTYP